MTLTVFYADADRPAIPRGLRRAGRQFLNGHDGPGQLTREHGSWHAGCNACGLLASWQGADLETISRGDGSCPAGEG